MSLQLNLDKSALASTASGELRSLETIDHESGIQYHFVDNFLRLIFTSVRNSTAVSKPPPLAWPIAEYQPLPLSKIRPDAGYHLPDPVMSSVVRYDSPAVEVMTDLRRVSAVTIDDSASITEANQTMINRAIRLLFVIDDRQRIAGVLTATDILGSKPVMIARQRGILHSEVSVRDIMTSVDRVEVVELSYVLKARVGDIVATLKHSGRQHALVVDHQYGGQAGRDIQMVRGIFSQTQIGRQLGDTADTSDDGRSFAEIATMIGV